MDIPAALAILDRLQRGAIGVYVLDQHADKKLGVAVDFFGKPAGTFNSLALLSLSTGAPIIPAATWREPGGSHVMRFAGSKLRSCWSRSMASGLARGNNVENGTRGLIGSERM